MYYHYSIVITFVPIPFPVPATHHHQQPMARKVRTAFLYVVVFIFLFASLYHHHYLRPPPPQPISLPAINAASSSSPHNNHHLLRVLPPPYHHHNTQPAQSNNVIDENLPSREIPPRVSPLLTPNYLLSTVSILLPDWEVLVILSPEDTFKVVLSDNYVCLYPNNIVSPATFSGNLQFPDRATFKCDLPSRNRRRFPFLQPVLTQTPSANSVATPHREMLRWTFIVYDSLTTEDDVVLFLKGLNNRQGFNRDPSEFNCVFFVGDDMAGNGVIRTNVTHSVQEVFRCKRPNLTDFHLYSNGRGKEEEEEEKEKEKRVKVSIEIVQKKLVVPTVAYYNPPRKLPDKSGISLLCACTMVYNVAKVLKEWVYYHSKIGIEKFILYDNGSNDNLENSVEELIKEGYDVKINFWLWQKTQEAGFSHAAVYARDSCSWMAYVDVDEFIFSPSWLEIPKPSKSMLHSLLQRNNSGSEEDSNRQLGQISMGCHEFGPSNQTVHPATGVTQGYNCRRYLENRHKSIVFLEGIDDSLINVIHHFNLKPEYRGIKMKVHDMVVNHYKFQAWPEFKAKFRRRVSAYVVDWTQRVNARSKDRAPGLGFSPVEPKGWPLKFCEVVDNGMKELTQNWFAFQSSSGYYKMAWQS